jgi:hypothetical protein
MRQNKIENEFAQIINQNIASGILTILSFDKNQVKSLHWLKKNEFRYKGDMYDVVMAKNGQDGKLYYYCFLDKKEKHLLVQLEKHVNRNIADNDKNQKNERNFIKNIVKDFFPVGQGFYLACNSIDLDFNTGNSDYHSVNPENNTPPPKSA